jgi:hypothetical protein
MQDSHLIKHLRAIMDCHVSRIHPPQPKPRHLFNVPTRIRTLHSVAVWSSSIDSCSSRSPFRFSSLFYLSVPLPFHSTTPMHLIKTWLISTPIFSHVYIIYYSYSHHESSPFIRPLQFYKTLAVSDIRPDPRRCWTPWPWPTNFPPCFRHALPGRSATVERDLYR